MSGLNVSLPEELRLYIDSRAGKESVYATPSEYIRDLIRRDMEEQAIVGHVLTGLSEVKQKKFSSKSILDILEEKS